MSNNPTLYRSLLHANTHIIDLSHDIHQSSGNDFQRRKLSSFLVPKLSPIPQPQQPSSDYGSKTQRAFNILVLTAQKTQFLIAISCCHRRKQLLRQQEDIYLFCHRFLAPGMYIYIVPTKCDLFFRMR